MISSLLPPRFLPSIFIAHRVQQSHCSSIFHRVLLTHVLELSASQIVRNKKSPRIYTSMHSGNSNSRNWRIPGSRITWYAAWAIQQASTPDYLQEKHKYKMNKEDKISKAIGKERGKPDGTTKIKNKAQQTASNYQSGTTNTTDGHRPTIIAGSNLIGTLLLCGSFFFSVPFIILTLLSRSLPVVTQIRGHIAGPPPSSPLRYMPSFSSRE